MFVASRVTQPWRSGRLFKPFLYASCIMFALLAYFVSTHTDPKRNLLCGVWECRSGQKGLLIVLSEDGRLGITEKDKYLRGEKGMMGRWTYSKGVLRGVSDTIGVFEYLLSPVSLFSERVEFISDDVLHMTNDHKTSESGSWVIEWVRFESTSIY